MRSLLLLPFLLGFSIPAFAHNEANSLGAVNPNPPCVGGPPECPISPSIEWPECPYNVYDDGPVTSTGPYCRTSENRYNSNVNCVCPDPGFKPDNDKKCTGYSATKDSNGQSVHVSQKKDVNEGTKYKVFDCYGAEN